MKKYLLRSRMHREELLRLGLIAALALWAATATFALVLKKERTILIGVSDDMSYLIQTTNPSIERRELSSFTKEVIARLYSFSPETYESKMSQAGDLMSQELWQTKQPEFLRMREQLGKEPLSQGAEIVSIDDLGGERLEATLRITIKRKLESTKAMVKVQMKLGKRERTDSNPWPYELREITDATL